MNRSMFIDAVGMVDADLIEAYVLKDMALRSRKRSKTKRYLVTLLAAAVALMLTFALLITSLPLVYITNREEIDSAVTEAIDRVIFPLDDEDNDVKQEDLLLNWTEWPITEQVFNALGAGTDHSIIDWMNGEHGGLAGEIWQRLGELLEKLYEYYQRHMQETGDDDGNTTQSEETQAPLVNQTVFEIIQNEDTCKIIDVVSYESTDIIVPEYYNDLLVVAIGERAFKNVPDITSISLPESVELIESSAFAGSDLLEKADMPGVRTIEYSAFKGCYLLKEVNMPQIEVIGNGAFMKCVSYETINFPNIISIGDQAFEGCEKLSEIRYGDTLVSLGDYAFRDCTSLIAVTVKESVTEFGVGCFQGCTRLDNATINNTGIVPDYTFDGCVELDTVQFYYTVTSIGAYAFNNCGKLTAMAGAHRWEYLGEYAFHNSAVSQMAFYGDVIPEHAFSDCKNLMFIQLDKSVKEIHSYAFNNCPRLEEIQILSPYIEEWEKIEIGEKAIDPEVLIVVGENRFLYQRFLYQVE